MKLPFISVCIPTYNNVATIEDCIKGVLSQDYDGGFEVLIIDGGSSDGTLEILRKFNVKILENPYKIEEKGRVIGIDNSKGEIISFIDADNFILDKFFFKKMTLPLIENDNVAISQPLYYVFRKDDDIFTQMLGLLSGDDPLAIALGMYERFNYLTLRWTDTPLEVVSRNEEYEVVKFLDLEEMPPIGSNGCFIKKNILTSVKYDPFIHTDICYRILKKGYLFSIVNTGLVHKQDGKLSTFIKKKNRRLNRNYEELEREFYQKVRVWKVFKVIIKNILFFPLILDALIGFIRKPAKMWFFYPFLMELTFWNAIIQNIKKLFLGRRIWG